MLQQAFRRVLNIIKSGFSSVYLEFLASTCCVKVIWRSIKYLQIFESFFFPFYLNHKAEAFFCRIFNPICIIVTVCATRSWTWMLIETEDNRIDINLTIIKRWDVAQQHVLFIKPWIREGFIQLPESVVSVKASQLIKPALKQSNRFGALS